MTLIPNYDNCTKATQARLKIRDIPIGGLVDKNVIFGSGTDTDEYYIPPNRIKSPLVLSILQELGIK